MSDPANRGRFRWLDSAQGALLAMSSEAIGRLAVLFFQWKVALLLGTSLYGTLGLGLASAATLLPLADMGMQATALRNLANSPGGEGFPSVLTLRAWGSAIYLVLLPLLGWLSAKEGISLQVLVLSGAYYLSLSLSDFLRQAFRALELPRPEFLARLSFLPAVAASLVLVQIVPPRVDFVLAIYGLAPLVLATTYLATLIRHGLVPRWEPRGALALLRTEWKAMAQSMLLLAAIAMVMRVDLWILDAKIDRSAVGVYLAGYNMVFAGAFLAQASATYFYPYLTRSGKPRSERILKVSLAQGGLAVGLFAGVFLLGPMAYGLIYNRPEFSRGTACLVWFGASLAVATMSVLWSNLLLVRNRQGLQVLALVLQVVAKIAIAPAFLDRWNTSGMAIASFAVDLPVCTVMGIIAVHGYLKADGRRSSDRDADPETASRPDRSDASTAGG